MAFPTIPTVAGGRVLFANQANTTATRTFPAFSGLTYSDGDLLIAIVTTYQSTTNPQFSSWSNGFTELSAGGDQGSSTTMGIGIAYKIASGAESGALTVTQAATITGHASMCLMAIPQAHASTAPEAGTIANGTAAAANPGAFNPAGWDTEDTLWISVAASGMTSGTGSWTGTGTTAPANYSNWADSNKTDNSTVGEVEIAVSFRQLNAASEDVGTVGVDTANARNSALLIAVRPAPSVTVALSGESSTSAAGSFGKALDLTLSGSAVTISAGTLAPVASYEIALTGATATTSAGTLTPEIETDASVALTGSTATGSAGTIGIELSTALAGSAVAAAAGTLSAALSVGLAGSEVTASAGMLAPASGITVVLIGTAITASSGSVGAGLSLGLSGLAASAVAGSFGLDMQIALTGSEVTAQDGSIEALPPGAVALQGQSVASAAGNLGTYLEAALLAARGSGSNLATTWRSNRTGSSRGNNAATGRSNNAISSRGNNAAIRKRGN